MKELGMKLRTRMGLAVLLTFSAVFGYAVTADDTREDTSQQSTDTFLVRVDEYELSTEIGSAESIEGILAMVADANRQERVSRSTACAVTAVCGVPARASYSRQVAFLQSANSEAAESAARSYEYVSSGTSLDVLLIENNGQFRVDVRYESSVSEDAKSEDTPPGESSTVFESTHFMKVGDVRLCGILETGATKVITLRLKQ